MYPVTCASVTSMDTEVPHPKSFSKTRYNMEEPLTETTPPILQDDEKKRKKYDRQLRLWAASGQQALEEAHVLLINSGPGVVGVETLKNLVLPGEASCGNLEFPGQWQ